MQNCEDWKGMRIVLKEVNVEVRDSEIARDHRKLARILGWVLVTIEKRNAPKRSADYDRPLRGK